MKQKTLAAMLLLAAGAALLIGCIPWSKNEVVQGQREISGWKTLGLKHLSRRRVEKNLGTPDARDESSFTYKWEMSHTSGALGPLCYAAFTSSGPYWRKL